MFRRTSLSVLGALPCILCGCQGPNLDTAVVCHNANCVQPLDSERDDTLPALEKSLALEFRGRPIIDGVELDLVWSVATGRCLFAHDASQADAAPAEDAAGLVAAHLERTGPVTRSGGPFYLKIELKGGGDPASARTHAACALDVYATVRDAATRGGRSLTTFFDSKTSALLSALVEHPTWATLSAGENVHLSAAFTLAGFGSSSALSDFDAPFDAVSLHPDFVSSATLDALHARNIQVTLWTQSLGARQLRVVAALEPVFVSTGDVELLGRWLDD